MVFFGSLWEHVFKIAIPGQFLNIGEDPFNVNRCIDSEDKCNFGKSIKPSPQICQYALIVIALHYPCKIDTSYCLATPLTAMTENLDSDLIIFNVML